MLNIEGLTKIYRVGSFGRNVFKAVDRVSFTIGRNQIISLIGESGSGKTTIGKMILKLTSISEGKIQFYEEDVQKIKKTNEKEYYKKVQGVFQDPFSSFNPIFKADRIFKILHREFYPALSVKDWDQKVKESLQSVGMNPSEVLNKYPHQLSGGQLQRFLIARALLLDVELLIADEIISMLDASTRIDVLNLLGSLKAQGLSVLFITHDLSLGYYISDQAIILYKGVIVEKGETKKVFLNPLHPYTQNIINSVPRLDQKWAKIKTFPKFQQYPVFTPGQSRGECSLLEIESDHYIAIEKEEPNVS